MIRAHDFNSSSTYVYGHRTSTTAQPWPIYVAFLDLEIIREFIVGVARAAAPLVCPGRKDRVHLTVTVPARTCMRACLLGAVALH